ncbi:toprim domain-containing protein, partial [Micrococcus sp. GbtcB5]|uniref:toprim domain-containing protein n=1 Tax=Micrococcus sp. GbtcB5 TaxID=2824750 RepID=UPI001C30F311
MTAPVPTGKKLDLVESPAKSKSIAKYLNAVGEGWVVVSSVGHIRDLPKPSDLPAEMMKGPFGKFAVATVHGFTPYYVVHPDKQKKVTEL